MSNRALDKEYAMMVSVKKKNARRVPGGECHLASHLPGLALRTFVES